MSADTRNRRAVLALLALVVAGAALVAWIALRPPADPAAGPAPVAGTAAATPDAVHADLPGRTGRDPRRPRAAGPNRWVAHGEGGVTASIREHGTDRPLAGLEVTLSAGSPGPDRTVTATTGADGAVVFDDVPAFEGWTFRVAAPAPLADAQVEGVAVAAGRRTDLGTVYLSPAFDVPGIVVDERGEPVAGAEVVAARRLPEAGRVDILAVLGDLPKRPSVVDSATSGADGMFRLTRVPPGSYDVAASHARFATAMSAGVLVTPASSERVLRIVVRAGHSVDGRVVRKGEGAVEGISVVAFGEPSGRRLVEPLLKRFAVTDAKGAFRFEGLAAGRAILVAAPEGEPLAVHDRVTVPGTEVVEIVLEGAASLEGTVTGPDGKPVAAARVFVLAEKAKAFAQGATDADGRYALRGLPAGQTAALLVSAEGLASFPEGADGFRNPRPEDGLTLAAGVNRRDVTLTAGGTVRGTVRDVAGGTPVPGVRVQAVGGALIFAPERGATSDAAGRFEIRGLAKGNAVLVAEKDGWYQPGMSAARISEVGATRPEGAPAVASIVIDDASTPVECDLEIGRAPVLRGRVLSPSGSPVASAEVRVEAKGAAAPSRIEAFLAPPPEPRLTDAAGRFEIAGGEPGREVRVVARAPGFAEGRSDVVTADPAAVVEGIDVRLRAPSAVEGRVTDAAGAPVAGAAVRVVVRGAGSAGERRRMLAEAPPTTAGADGSFRVDDLDPGPVVVQVTHPRYVAWFARDLVAEEGKTVRADAVLAIGAVLAGVVADPSDRPVAGARVVVRAAGSRSQDETWTARGDSPAVAGPDGTFRFEGLPPGPWTVQASAEGFVGGRPVEVAVGTTDVTVRLEPAFTIAGTVSLRGAGPVAGAAVRVTAPGAGGAESGRPALPAPPPPGGPAIAPAAVAARPSYFAQTGPGGEFEVRGVPAGTYEVRVTPPDRGEDRLNALPATLGGVAAGARGVAVVLEPGAKIEGTVHLADGSPAESGAVWCRLKAEPGARREEGTSGRTSVTAGRFTIVGLVPGTYDVTVTVPDHVPATRTAQAGDAGLRFDLSAGGTVRGRAVRADGSPAQGANVTLSGPGQASGSTDEDGRFEIGGLADGTWTLRVLQFGNEVQEGTAQGVVVREGHATDVPDVTMTKRVMPSRK